MTPQAKKQKQKQRANNERVNPRLLAVGAFLWLTTIQFYIVQWLVARSWPQGFSLDKNYISDLGNTLCTSTVCSPEHAAMNASFVVLGVAMGIGALLFAYAYAKNNGAAIGFLCLALSGLGTIFVGAFPADVNGPAHGTGAFTSFLIGNVGLVILGISLHIPRLLRIAAIVLGLVALIALAFFVNNQTIGVGIGALERIVAYPQTIWMIAFAAYILTVLRRDTKSV